MECESFKVSGTSWSSSGSEKRDPTASTCDTFVCGLRGAWWGVGGHVSLSREIRAPSAIPATVVPKYITRGEARASGNPTNTHSPVTDRQSHVILDDHVAKQTDATKRAPRTL
eukprot:6132140-Prymnesium_polylepis.3